MVGYEVRVEAGESFDNAMKLRATWSGTIVYVEDDGRETRTGISSCYWQSGDPNKRRTRGRLNIELGRLRSYEKRNGKRWEVERAEAAAAKAKAEKEEREAAKRVRDAAPDMLAALKEVEVALSVTLDQRGYKKNSCTDGWAPCVQGEVRALVKVQAAIAKAEGR